MHDEPTHKPAKDVIEIFPRNDPRKVELPEGGSLTCVPRIYDWSFANQLYLRLRKTVRWEEVLVREQNTRWLTSSMTRRPTRRSVGRGRPSDTRDILEALATRTETLGESSFALDRIVLNLLDGELDQIPFDAEGAPSFLRGGVATMLSLGEPRKLVLEHRTSGQRVLVHLMHGSLLVLAGVPDTRWRIEVQPEPGARGGHINIMMSSVARPTPRRVDRGRVSTSPIFEAC